MIIWSNILIPVASMMITVFATIYTVSKRVKNENREKHKPYLTLNTIETLKEIDEYKYYLTITGQNKTLEKKETESESIENNYQKVMFLIDNIGYGVASNIKFYNLKTSKQVEGTQKTSKEKNQKLFTTFDIASNQEKKVQAKIINTPNNQHRILCIYQDLNGNVYDFIIIIDTKSTETYDFYTYQRTSHSYKKIILEEEQQYKKIIKEYKK